MFGCHISVSNLGCRAKALWKVGSSIGSTWRMTCHMGCSYIVPTSFQEECRDCQWTASGLPVDCQTGGQASSPEDCLESRLESSGPRWRCRPHTSDFAKCINLNVALSHPICLYLSISFIIFHYLSISIFSFPEPLQPVHCGKEQASLKSYSRLQGLWKLGIEQAVLGSFKYNSPFEEVLPTGTGSVCWRNRQKIKRSKDQKILRS